MIAKIISKIRNIFVPLQAQLIIKAKKIYTMQRDKYILAVMSVSNGAEYTPVQIQKLFFLLDKNLSKHIDGPYFHFEPYNYGPFDKDVYRELDTLRIQNFVDLNFGFNNLKKYRLTVQGQKEGENIFNSLTDVSKDYIKRVDEFVRNLSFDQLIRAVYAEYPEMKAKSIFSS
jgi:uncharacterized protein